MHYLTIIFVLIYMLFPIKSWAYDSVNFNPVPIAINSTGGGGVPIGTIVTWPILSLPGGSEAGKWLECNGQSTAGYPELAAIVGGTVPDYRGHFLRGVGGNSAAIGVAQGDAIRNITGNLNLYHAGPSGYSGAFYSGGWFSYGWWDGGYIGGYDNWFAFDASRVVPTAAENRPLNKAVKYIIRALP